MIWITSLALCTDSYVLRWIGTITELSLHILTYDFKNTQ